MVDTTQYTSREKTPELALRQIFVRARLPEQIRLKLAENICIDADTIAAMGDSLSNFKEQAKAIFPADQLGGDERRRQRT